MEYTKERLKKMMKESGWSLDLRGTGITSLPDGLSVGGSLDLRGTGIKNPKFKRLKDGDYVPNKYIYADGILTHVKSIRVVNGYTLYIGKFKGRNVVSDGTYYAHCDNFRDGIADLRFKAAKDRDAEQYKRYSMDTVVELDDAKTMYRIITGACRAGTEAFAESLGETIKDRYSVREMIELTKDQYGGETFRRFFEE